MRLLFFSMLTNITIMLMLTGCARKEQSTSNEIIIGEYGSLSGSEATFGVSTKQGIDLAAAEINTAGGVLGRKIVVKVENDESLEERVAAAVQKLINYHNALVIIGEVASGRSLVGGPICENAQVPMVTPSSTNPKVTEGKRWVFRVCWTDDFQGEAMAKFAFETLGARKAAVFSALNQAYSQGLAEFFEKTFKKLGGTIVASESYQGGKDRDFKAQLTNIKSANPDVLFIPGYYTDVGAIATQARQVGITVPMLGGDGWEAEELFTQAKEVIEGSYYSTHYSSEEKRPEVTNFVRAYKAKFGKTPDAMAALGYDAMKVVADAIKRAGTLDREAIRKALEETKDFRGVTGVITIDANHNARKPLVVQQLKNGRPTFVKTVAP